MAATTATDGYYQFNGPPFSIIDPRINGQISTSPLTHTLWVQLNFDFYSTVLLNMIRRPMVTGSSVLGLTFEGGVILAADTLGMLCYITSKTLKCTCDVLSASGWHSRIK